VPEEVPVADRTAGGAPGGLSDAQPIVSSSPTIVRLMEPKALVME
jgi:hypothetical protein